MERLSENRVRSNHNGQDEDIVLEGLPTAPSSNGNHDLGDLPEIREGQRLCRVPHWSLDSPYVLMGAGLRMFKAGISLAAAEDYLLQLGWSRTRVDIAMYHSEVWADRLGTRRPLYPLRESDPPLLWDVAVPLEGSVHPGWLYVTIPIIPGLSRRSALSSPG
jgi:hypothetical protein